jgi:NAD dependent epimerase/dehydratase
MKRVLVTGADGFIGSHLVENLVRQGYQVRALTQYNSFNNWGWLEATSVLKDIEVRSGDIRDPFYCEKLTEGMDTVLHLAALIAIPYSYVAPQSYVETNITGTLNMCQAALKHNCSKFVQTSTSEVYGTAQYVPIDEKHPLQPQSPYSATKIGADNVALSYFNAFKLPVTVARPFNTYGPRQSARAVIPTIIAQIQSGQKTIDLGDLRPTRDFNFVTDTCNSLIELAKQPIASTGGQVFNLSSNFEISIRDLVLKIKKISGRDIEVVEDESRLRPENSEVFRLWGDNTKFSKLTNYKPQVDLDSGLARTYEWFGKSDNLKKYKAGIYNV